MAITDKDNLYGISTMFMSFVGCCLFHLCVILISAVEYCTWCHTYL